MLLLDELRLAHKLSCFMFFVDEVRSFQLFNLSSASERYFLPGHALYR